MIFREYERFYLSFYLRIFENKKFIGFLMDISDNGFKVMSEFPHSPDKVYNIQMKLPKIIRINDTDEDSFINFTSICRWTAQDDSDRDFHLNGFEFIDIDKESKEMIRELINQFSVTT